MDEKGAGQTANTRRANVLLVDDKSENLVALEAVLADLGQNLVRAISARDALRHLLVEDFALILLDVQMPGLSGFELAELIRERERTQHTPMIFISAEAIQQQSIFRGYSLGAVDYLTKPIEPEILKSKVRFFSRLYLQQDQIRQQARELREANARLDELNADLEERVRLRTEELEQANRELMAEVTERRRSEARLATEHAITKVLAVAADTEAAVSDILKVFIESLGADVAARWEIVPDGSSITCSNIAVAVGVHPNVGSFVTETRRRRFALGEGLPGQVWKTGSTVWLPSTLQTDNFPRSTFAASAGLLSAIGFPIKIGSEICGVIEFFSKAPLEADQKLLDMLDAVGSEIGQFLQRKRIESEREELLLREKSLREEAEKANRMKDEFLATLSHELRTPLNSILGWSQIILGDMVDEEGMRTALETIHRNATAQAQLIEELLEASRLITGKILLNLEPTDVATVVETAVDIVRPRATAKGVELGVSIGPDVGTITSDPTRLQQMIWNLVTNAVKFTPAGGRVDVEADRNSDRITISVRDTGIGISPDFLPYVFDRFRQQDSTSTRRHEGLGLGLAIVRQLCELHGGDVAAQSGGLNQGSTFTISLPVLHSAEDEAFDIGSTDRTVENIVDESLKGLSIHIVDDDVDSCDMLRYAFRLRGADVRVSNNASHAFQTIAEEPPDVLLADINMPDEDGYSLIRKIRTLAPQRTTGFPTIALTAMARAEDSEKALAAGFDLHIPKPVEIDELAQAIRDLLENANTPNAAANVR